MDKKIYAQSNFIALLIFCFCLLYIIPTAQADGMPSIKDFSFGMSKAQVSAILKEKYQGNLGSRNTYVYETKSTDEFGCKIKKDIYDIDYCDSFIDDNKHYGGIEFVFAHDKLIEMSISVDGDKEELAKMLQSLYGGKVIRGDGHYLLARYFAESQEYTINAFFTRNSTNTEIIYSAKDCDKIKNKIIQDAENAKKQKEKDKVMGLKDRL